MVILVYQCHQSMQIAKPSVLTCESNNLRVLIKNINRVPNNGTTVYYTAWIFGKG